MITNNRCQPNRQQTQMLFAHQGDMIARRTRRVPGLCGRCYVKQLGGPTWSVSIHYTRKASPRKNLVS